MVRETHKLKHDPTLALSILSFITLPPLSTILEANCPQQIQEVIEKIKHLNKTNRGNEVHSLLEILQLFQNTYEGLNLVLSEIEQTQINHFFDSQLQSFYELSFNSRHHQITPQNVTDAFTLNETCYFITALNVLIEELSPSEFKTEPSKENSASFYSAKVPYKLVRKELNLAQKLREFSEQIRSQIGSPETRPRGLIITLMWHLCDAENTCNTIYKEEMVSPRPLLSLICKIIEQIKRSFPDLAEAGEDLHKAIANYQTPKP